MNKCIKLVVHIDHLTESIQTRVVSEYAELPQRYIEGLRDVIAQYAFENEKLLRDGGELMKGAGRTKYRNE